MFYVRGVYCGILKPYIRESSSYLRVQEMQNKTNKREIKKRLRKKLFFSVFPLFLVGLVFVGAETVHAGVADTIGYYIINVPLYGLFKLVGLFTSAAVAMFAYVVDPQNISGPTGLLNLQATYDMWKFVRDIVNIFFILGLLFIAFSFVFQLDGYSNSKAIIKLVIAALAVNFSFPLARIIIDLANVPMYFFLQMILGDGDNASVALSSALGASGLETFLLPGGADSDVSTLLSGIIFLFLFTITILVLAFQLLIRLIALVVLLILSPIGFVANYIPGLKEKGFGKKWWDNFLNYTLFGPASIFMLVIATNFFAAVRTGDQGKGLAIDASATSADPSFTASMVMFFVPITMLWFAMGVSKSFSIAGADIATKYGKDFSKWAGKKVSSPVTTRYKAAKKGVQKGLEKGNILGFKYGEKVPGGKYLTGKYWDDRTAETEARWTGGISGGRKGIQSEMEKLHAKKVAEEEKSLEENRTSEATLRATMNDTNADKAKREAAVRVLSKKDALRTGDDITKALEAIEAANGGHIDETRTNLSDVEKSQLAAQKEKKAEIIKKAGGEIYQTGDELATAIKALGDDVKGVNALIDKASGKALGSLNTDQYNEILTSSSIPSIQEAIKGKLNSKLKKEGETKILIQADIDGGMTRQDAYDKHLGKMSAEDIGKMSGVHGDRTTPMDAELKDFIERKILSDEWTEKQVQDAYSKLNADQQAAWRRAGLP